MVRLRSGRSTSTSRVTIKLEEETKASTETSQLTTKRRHGTEIVARNAKLRPRLNPPQPRSGLGNFAAFETETPLVLSPSSTVSTAASPGDVNSVWDSPDRNRDHADETPKSEASSPMTPPTGDIVKSVPRAQIAVRLSARATASGNKKSERVQADDCFFEPGKLFRNLTKVFQAIADAHALAAKGEYMLAPDFDFEYNIPAPSLQAAIGNKARIRSADKNVKLGGSDISTRALPKHVDVLEQIVPYSIHTRLAQNSHLCVASLVRRTQDKCSSKRPSGSINMIVGDILSCDAKANHIKFLGLIKELVCVAMCGTHRNAALSKRRQAELEVLLGSLSHPSTQNFSDIQAWIEAISNSKSFPVVTGPVEHVLFIAHESAPRKPGKALIVQAARPAIGRTTKVVPTVLEHSPHFSPYQPKRTKSFPVSKALRELIIKPLTPTDRKPGFIYLFWDKEHFGKLKIGRTKDLKQRLNDWNRKCKREHAYHPAIKRGELPEIPHVSRVEQLIHVELKDSRRKMSCAGCNKTHQEWFAVSDALALKVFQKWQDWITQEPYGFDARTKKWVLKPEMISTLSQVCEPVSPELIEQPPHRNRAAKKGKRKSPRQAIGSKWIV